MILLKGFLFLTGLHFPEAKVTQLPGHISEVNYIEMQLGF